VPVTSADHSQGPENAPLTVVEYGDYQCPGCGQAYPIVKQIQKHFGKRLRFVFRNFPLNESHPEAESAAETAEFAGARGTFCRCTTHSTKTRTGLAWSFTERSQKSSVCLSPIWKRHWRPAPAANACAPTFPAASAAASMAHRRSTSMEYGMKRLSISRRCRRRYNMPLKS
jgi:Thioredoxin